METQAYATATMLLHRNHQQAGTRVITLHVALQAKAVSAKREQEQ